MMKDIWRVGLALKNSLWQWPAGRGEGITRERGEGFVGTIIKDTQTIKRGGNRGGRWGGWGGGEGWGEKAENCTWTAIKICWN